MEPSQQGPRQTAAEAFMESLNQLEQSLQTGDRSAPLSHPAGDRSVQSPQVDRTQPRNQQIDVEALEEAAADIEQFIQMKNSVSEDELF